MNFGLFGKVLWVDLSNETFKEEIISKKDYRLYIGGFGLGCKLLYENMPSKISCFAEDSIIGFFPGLLTGTAAPLTGRYMVVGKSPLTNTWGDSNAGGTFGPSIKKCGYDGILIRGKANSPKAIIIKDQQKQILDAGEYWGSDIVKTERQLKERFGKTVHIASIGRAGEMISKISGIANDNGRIAARAGLGAIMGSKKLKALILKGNENIKMFNKKQFMELVRNYNKKATPKDPSLTMNYILYQLPNMAKMLRKLKIGMSGPASIIRTVYKYLGTIAGNTIAAENGDTPIKNWSGIGMYDFPFEKSIKLSSSNIVRYKQRNYGCFGCPIQCGAILKVPELDIEETHQPEYETCAAFGPFLLNDDLMSIFLINDLCNRAAIDTISTGATIGFAIECFEKGILTEEDTDGLELTWGNSEAIINLTKKIINREGIGNILADGCKNASEIIGKGSEKFAFTSLGSEIPMHNPRAIKSLAFSYAYDPTPGRHTTASIDFFDIGNINTFVKELKFPFGWKWSNKRKIKAQIKVSAIHQIISCLGLCLFSSLFGTYPLIDLINSLTGWDVDIEELIETGIRIQSLRQAFNIRDGLNIYENELQGRIIGDPPDIKGPNKGVTVEYKKFYKYYCQEIGWNPENGYPLRKTLEKLSLDYVKRDIYES
jgi:aldehyde:ferredoxin oxidoreductase